MRVGLGIAVVLLLGVAYFMVFYSDASRQVETLKREEVSLRSQLTQERESESLYLADVAELAEKQRKQRDVQKVLPDTAEAPAFLSALQNVANATGVSLNSWEPLNEVAGQFFTKVPMKLSLSGHYHQVAKFFYGIGQLERIINLENIVMTNPKREGDEVFVKVECLATAFHATMVAAAANAPKETMPTPAGSR